MRFNTNVERAPTFVLPQFGKGNIQVTNRYIEVDGKPCIPVMGELHISRVPVERWRETLLKMKESGIDVVASYLFWIHHEEEKGIFDFTGNKNLRAFINLCHELGLHFCLRIGPYVNAECRNGGLPDWVVNECGNSVQTDKEPYWSYVLSYIHAVAEQIRDLEFWGIQVDNEVWRGAEYLNKVLNAVLAEGFTAPLYTATAWGNAPLPETLLPMFGGYPDAPWEENINPLGPNPNLFFSRQREDGLIGSDLLGRYGIAEDKYKNRFPFLTCESGGGNQIGRRRRPLFVSEDIEDLTIVKIGNGANLMGYYMYAGGLNPIGKLSTMQKSDYPIISYDFQAPIGDMGQLRRSWFRLSRINTFLHAFGEMLAPMDTNLPDVMPTDLSDETTLRCALRTDGKGGFMFISNRVRLNKLPSHPEQHFDIEFEDRTLSFEVDIPEDCTFFFPVGIKLAGIDIKYITAQPVSLGEKYISFSRIRGMKPVAVLTDGRTFDLEEGCLEIDGSTVELLGEVDYKPTKGEYLSVEKVANTISPDLLMGHIADMPDLTKEYAISWDEEVKYLVISAKGNFAGFYVDGNLITDQVLNGDKWVVDVRFMETRNAIIKVQPFREIDKGTMYIEIPVEIGDFVPEVLAVKENVVVV